MMGENHVTRSVVATLDSALRARVVRRMPLLYRQGADPATDRPPHVRAGSGLAWTGDRLAVVQDDANFLALIDVDTGQCEVVVLPAHRDGARQFDDSRENKNFKNDFEALIAIGNDGQRLLAFGSGSSPLRESILVVDNSLTADPAVRVIQAPELYAALRTLTEFCGSELNLEGAALCGADIRLFQRGNGAPREGLRPMNATCDIDCAALLRYLDHSGVSPVPRNVVQYQLGHIGGVQLSFTDAVSVSGDVCFVTAAEDSPDAVRDGVVAGSAIGIITERGEGISARWTPLTGADDTIARAKVEGIARGRRADQLFVVVDRDDHKQASELWEVEVSGFSTAETSAQQ